MTPTATPASPEPDPGPSIGIWERYGLGRPIERPLRFGVLLDSMTVPAWQAVCLRGLVESGVAVPSLFVLPRSGPPRRPIGDIVRFGAYYLARATIWRARATRPVSVADLFGAAPVIRARTRRTRGAWHAFEADDVGAVRAADLDFILRFGFALIEGDILDAARLGVWSFHHGDERRFRGRPAGFWELHEGVAEIGVVLQRLTERLDAGTVLRRGVFAVDPASYGRTLDRAYLGAADFPLQVCRDLVLGNAPTGAGLPSATDAPVRRMPRSRQVVRVLAWTAVAAIRRGLYGAFVLKRWSVATMDGGPDRLLRGEVTGARWIRARRRTRFYADPIVVPGTAGSVLLCEEFDYAIGRGRIARVELSRSGPAGVTPSVRVETLIDEPAHHLSYPSLVPLDDGTLWCTPEMAASRGLSAYRLAPDARAVLGSERIVEGIAMIDPTIFRHGDRWWLACTEDGPTSLSHLWLYHAVSPAGPWTAHARNPVKVDVGGARSAGGVFTHDGARYRPAQDCRDGYGRAVTLFRIVALTPTEFDEEAVVTISPDPAGPAADGLHTVSVGGGVIAIDGYHNVLHPLAGWYRLGARRRRRPSG